MNVSRTVSTRRSLASAFDGPNPGPPPIWLMRQAGRYLPEYKAVRAAVGSFLGLCLDPERAAEVTLQPIRRFDFDAAIVFSDILMVPYALARNVRFVEGEGPRLDPIEAGEIAALDTEPVAAALRPVFETVGLVRDALPAGKSLIGFCGAPWTVATYMVAGRGTPDQAPARTLAARDPGLFQILIDRLVDASVESLAGQLEAGADVVQIFDSWAGVLNERDFARWSVAPCREIVTRLRQRVPGARVIGFPKGAGLRLEDYVRETGIDGVGVDWTTPLAYARDRLQPLAAVQGNLDPIVLLAGGDEQDRSVDAILESLGDGRLIFNLGHGILPETPIPHVERLVERVRRQR